MARTFRNRTMEFRMEAGRTFRIIGLCGLTGVLVDFDHFLALFLWQYVNPNIDQGRLWHTPLFIITGLAICGICAHLGRLHHKRVLTLVGIAVVMLMLSVLIYSPGVVWSWSE